MDHRKEAAPGKKKYLVIKHGALGDFIMATGPFEAIRRRHPKSHIVLLTTRPFKELAEMSPFFDEVWIDERPHPLAVDRWWHLIRKIRQARFKMIYDLQTSSRSSTYFRLLGRKKPLWSGILTWCSHPHTNPRREKMHTIDRQREQLELAGIRHVPKPHIGWLKADISRYRIPEPFAVIVPGGSLHRPEKRWTEKGFEDVARFLVEQGITPVFVGAFSEQGAIFEITRMVKGSMNLCGQTSFADIAELGRHASFSLGNDTGPMHILALGGKPTLVLFSAASDPQLCAPRGTGVRLVQEESLPDLKSSDVISLIREMLKLDTK
jgi:ADP-heptose:LPS heptosyltransferase